MPKLLACIVVSLMSVNIAARVASADGVGTSKSYHGPTGLQLYSLRDMQQKEGVDATLDKARDWGFKYVEVAALGKLTSVQFKAQLDRRGLVPVGMHFPYDRLRDDIEGSGSRRQGPGAALRRLRVDPAPGTFYGEGLPGGGWRVQSGRRGVGPARHKVLLPQPRLRVRTVWPRHALRPFGGPDQSADGLFPNGCLMGCAAGAGSRPPAGEVSRPLAVDALERPQKGRAAGKPVGRHRLDQRRPARLRAGRLAEALSGSGRRWA